MFNLKGFTLVELLVVIAILAILTTVGVVQYWGINARARDSARKADIYEIASALEVNKTAQGYSPLQGNHFSSFQWVDPGGAAYCIGVGNPVDPLNTTAWGANCPSGYEAVAPGVPTGNVAAWKVCTFLENSAEGAQVFCKVSSQ